NGFLVILLQFWRNDDNLINFYTVGITARFFSGLAHNIDRFFEAVGGNKRMYQYAIAVLASKRQGLFSDSRHDDWRRWSFIAIRQNQLGKFSKNTFVLQGFTSPE